MMGFGMSMVGLGMLMMIGFWVIVIGGGVWLVVTIMRGNQGTAVPKQPNALITPPASISNLTPLDIVKARYARGEITKEQYEEMRHDLGA